MDADHPDGQTPGAAQTTPRSSPVSTCFRWSIDFDSGMEVVDATGVLATGETVYASAESVYVATQSWQVWQWGRTGVAEGRPQEISTEIHKFDTSGDEVTTYRATGRVPGYLLNQFAMDEHDALLRVASTTCPAWWGSGFESASRVTVFEEEDGELVRDRHGRRYRRG